MKQVFSLALFALSIAWMPKLPAQLSQSVVHGVVRDALTGEALRGVSIEAESALYGTISNNNGEFVLSLGTEKAVAVNFNRAGYKDTQITVIPASALVEIALRKAGSESAEVVASRPDAMSESTLRLNLMRKLISLTTLPDAAAKKNQPLVIGVIGHNPFGEDLFAFEQLSIAGREVEITFLGSADEISDKQDVLYICKANKALMQEIHAALGQHHLLSIADRCGGFSNRVVLEIVKADDRVGFRASNSAAMYAGVVLAPVVYELSAE